ncbi:MAG: hypothetical protein AB1566_04505 [Chloroflexota bacterium]
MPAPTGPTPAPTIQPAEALIATTPGTILPSACPPIPSPTASFYTEYKIEHFTIYYTADVSFTQVLSASHYLEAAWRDIPAFLGYEPPDSPIRVYIGLPIKSGGTGSPTGVITLRKEAIDRDYAGIPHEFTHVLTRCYGPQWMEEGLAMYMQERFPAGEYRADVQISADSWSIGLLRANKWVDLWKFPIGQPDRTSPAITFELMRAYYESGSFVKYLIETYGVAAFRKMHDDVNGWFAAEKAYGKSIDALIEEWRHHLDNSTIPAKDCPKCIAHYFEWTDVDIWFDQHKNNLSGGIHEQVLQELKAVNEAFIRKDAQAMQQHVKAARQLLEANINK